MRALSAIILLALLVLPTGASAEVQTFTATHTYILGDHDSKDDARQRCLLEAKRKVLEQAGVYIESASEVQDFAFTKDKITSFAAAVMQVKDTKEKLGFENGHMTMTLTIKADVDLAEVRKQLAARQVDKGMRDTVAVQQERLKRLEAQVEAIQLKRQVEQAQGHTESNPHVLTELGKALLIKEAYEGDATSQNILGTLYERGEQGLSQDYVKARQWFEKSARQGNAWAQIHLAVLYTEGKGVSRDYTKANHWYEKAATQGQAQAQFMLGHAYYEGKGTSQDYMKARYWFEQAAAQGDSGGQVLLALLYKNGHGVPQDDVRAYMWYNLAALSSTAEDQKFKVELRDIFARRLTAEQLTKAQRLTEQCQSQQFKNC